LEGGVEDNTFVETFDEQEDEVTLSPSVQTHIDDSFGILKGKTGREDIRTVKARKMT